MWERKFLSRGIVDSCLSGSSPLTTNLFSFHRPVKKYLSRSAIAEDAAQLQNVSDLFDRFGKDIEFDAVAFAKEKVAAFFTHFNFDLVDLGADKNPRPAAGTFPHHVIAVKTIR